MTSTATTTPMTEGQQRRPGFRADVQGLRAIAVGTVVVAHSGLPLLPGGYVGVDVFFVISGFLISGLLFREVERSGSLSISGFYARRARRILPAATVVTIATLIASMIWLSVVDALDVMTDAVWATFFAANVHFAAVGTDYFAAEQGPSPLQHYWSLSVEEQFYLLWPLLLVGCLWWGRRKGVGLPRRTVLTVLLVAGTVSFGYGVWLTQHHAVASYFSSPARAWELGLGALAALVGTRVADRLPGAARGALAAVGLGLIAFACVTFDAHTPFPGYAALVPVVGSALVLVAGAAGQGRQPWPVRALSIRPMRLVGDWSYSIYLWHWPLLVIAERHLGRDLSTRGTLVALVLILALSGLTYRFVETPFRTTRRLPSWRALVLYPASAVVVVALAVGGNTWGQWRLGEFGSHPAVSLADFGVPDESSYQLDQDPTVALVQASVLAARNHMAVPSDLAPAIADLRDDLPDVGECDYEQDVRTLCPVRPANATRTLALFGNSHARMWIPAFTEIANDLGYRAYFFVKPNCSPALVSVGDLVDGSRWDACADFKTWALDQIDQLQPDLVVVSTSPPNPTLYDEAGARIEGADAEESALRQGFVDVFHRLHAASGRALLIRDVPKSKTETLPDSCLSVGHPDLGTCMFTPLASSTRSADISVEAAEATGTEVLDPTPWVCWQDQCPIVVGNVITYRDRGHLTTVYARSLADELVEALDLS